MQRIVLALALTGAAGLIAPQCTVRAPRAGQLRAEAAEAPAEATPAPTFKVIDIPSDKWTAAQKQEKTALETAAPPASTSPPEAPRRQRRAAGPIRRRRGTTSTPSRRPDAVDARDARDAMDAIDKATHRAGPRKKKKKKSSTRKPRRRSSPKTSRASPSWASRASSTMPLEVIKESWTCSTPRTSGAPSSRSRTTWSRTRSGS